MTAQFARRGQLRLAAAVVILAGWGAGLSLLVRREYFQGRPQKLAEAALRLSPSATYFEVDQGGKRIGFASTTIDTLTNGIDAVEYFVADVQIAGKEQRTSTRSIAKLSRTLSLRAFDHQLESGAAPVHIGGRPDGDSAMVYAVVIGTQQADSVHLRVPGPVLLPPVVPIAIALEDKPKIGRHYTLSTFDPQTRKPMIANFAIDAESLFTLADSAKYDPDKGEWKSVLMDTVRAWHASAPNSKDAFSGWIDAQGRVVEASRPDGITLKRTAYELAFENWRIARDRSTASKAGTGDILERTAIAANAKFGRAKLISMTVELGAPSLRGFDFDGGRQHFSGDTLRVLREKDATLGANAPDWREMHQQEFKARFHGMMSAEPLLQAGDREIIPVVFRIVGDERNPKLMAQKVNQWISDSIVKVATYGVPNALAVLRSRKGDANELTQLYVAMMRSIGFPTRIASGLLYVSGKFYTHTWPEVWLGEWVAVDPTLDQFPADASHLRFVLGGYSRQSQLLQLIGNLKIKVLEAK